MDIIGKWKVKEFHIPTPDGMQVFTPETLPDEEEYEVLHRWMRTFFEFTPDGDSTPCACSRGDGRAAEKRGNGNPRGLCRHQVRGVEGAGRQVLL